MTLTTLLAALLLQASGPAADFPTSLQQSEPPAAKDEKPGFFEKGSFPGSYKVAGSNVSFKFGGYLKVDVIHDFDPIGSEDTFDPRTIPTDDSKGENTQVQAKQTRFNLDIRTPTDLGDARLFFEVDFFGSGSTLRLRHAYGTLGGLLVGQTWTTFMDEDAMPPTLDFEEPVAYATVRVAQVRWTQTLSDDWYIAFAVEAPDSELDTMPMAGKREDPYPDLTSRLRWSGDWGHLQLSGWAGWAQYRQTVGGVNQAFLWGTMLAGSINTIGKDRFMFQAAFGDGVGRYRSGVVAGPDANGDLEAIPVAAVTVDYQHYWTEAWSSNIVYAVAHASPLSGQAGTTLKTTRYAAVNLVYSFLSWASVGVEYLYGYRKDLDDSDGEANRIQISFKFNIP